MSLPSFNTSDRILAMLQDRWSALIDPVLACPLVKGRLITSIAITSGDNTINHKLSRKLTGWIVVGQTAASNFYDKQANNQMSDKTLVLNSSAPCTLSLWVF